MSLIRGSPSFALLGQQAGFAGNDCDENKLSLFDKCAVDPLSRLRNGEPPAD